MARADLLAALAGDLAGRRVGHPLRVGIDGVCGAGKSRFARDLVAALEERGRPVRLVDSDGFHHVSRVRRSGHDPARGYYENAYDFDRLVADVLVPLGPGGDRRYATRVHDLATDEVVEDAWAVAEDEAVVVFDCTFLQRGDLRRHWDVVVFLDVDPETARARGIVRDAHALGGRDAAEAAYDARYHAACLIYLEEERPRERADVVVDHEDPARPRFLRLDV
ncbi:MAG TPA: uridine kinase [Marmoricola sp.]|nr:uridine kinase [Marmoricola sp.]